METCRRLSGYCSVDQVAEMQCMWGKKSFFIYTRLEYELLLRATGSWNYEENVSSTLCSY